MTPADAKKVVSTALCSWGAKEIRDEVRRDLPNIRLIDNASTRAFEGYIHSLKQTRRDEFLDLLVVRTEAAFGLRETRDLQDINRRELMSDYFDFCKEHILSSQVDLRIHESWTKNDSPQSSSAPYLKKRGITSEISQRLLPTLGVATSVSSSAVSFSADTKSYRLLTELQVRRSVGEVAATYTLRNDAGVVVSFVYPIVFVGENAWKIFDESDFSNFIESFSKLSQHFLPDLIEMLNLMGNDTHV